MVTVRHEPRNEIIIHEISPYDSVADFVSNLVVGLPGPNFPPIQWAEGVLMNFNALPFTDTVSKEIIEGKLHWDHVACALMEEFRENVDIPNRGMTIPIINVERNETFKAIGIFLRDEILSP